MGNILVLHTQSLLIRINVRLSHRILNIYNAPVYTVSF